jgi:hypothetical protein
MVMQFNQTGGSRMKPSRNRSEPSGVFPAILLAGVAATALPSQARSATVGPINVTSIQTRMVSSTGSDLMKVSGVATAGSYSGFTSSKSYSVDYQGQADQVLSVTGGGVTYSATGLATNVVRRVTSPNNNDQLWYLGSGNASSPTLTLTGPSLGGFSQAFDTNNIDLGADNLFSNSGNAVGNNSNVTRLDLLFGAFHASSSTAFAIFDRGPTNDHDAFKIAAITAVDSNGNPTNYGPLLSYSDGSWGTTDVMPTQEELILRENNTIPLDELHPSDITDQAVGGVIVPTSSLVSTPGQTIYGYSLFAPTVTATGSALDNWQDFALADSTSTGGGIDPAATVAVLFTTTAVPEPASIGLIAVGGALLSRRARRRAA